MLCTRIQETRWTDAAMRYRNLRLTLTLTSGATVMGKGMSRYKFFWQGGKNGNAGVGLLISDRWIDRIIEVKRVNERIMCLKLIGDKLVTCICALHMHLKQLEVLRRKILSGIK